MASERMTSGTSTEAEGVQGNSTDNAAQGLHGPEEVVHADGIGGLDNGHDALGAEGTEAPKKKRPARKAVTRPEPEVTATEFSESIASGSIVTFSGKVVYPLELEESKVCIEDIAHGLSNICRFTGQTRDFYSVAQHSVLVSWSLNGTGKEFDGLMHDAAEAYLGDVVRPLKGLDEFEFYRGAIARAEAVIASKFGTEVEMSDAVIEADLGALATEYRDLMPKARNDDGTDRWGYLDDVIPFFDKIIPWHPRKAKDMFLLRYQDLVPAATRARIAVA